MLPINDELPQEVKDYFDHRSFGRYFDAIDRISRFMGIQNSIYMIKDETKNAEYRETYEHCKKSIMKIHEQQKELDEAILREKRYKARSKVANDKSTNNEQQLVKKEKKSNTTNGSDDLRRTSSRSFGLEQSSHTFSTIALINSKQPKTSKKSDAVALSVTTESNRSGYVPLQQNTSNTTSVALQKSSTVAVKKKKSNIPRAAEIHQFFHIPSNRSRSFGSKTRTYKSEGLNPEGSASIHTKKQEAEKNSDSSIGPKRSHLGSHSIFGSI